MTNAERKELGQMIREKRKALGWSLDAAEKETKIDKSTLWRIEKGVKVSSDDLIFTYAEKVGCDPRKMDAKEEEKLFLLRIACLDGQIDFGVDIPYALEQLNEIQAFSSPQTEIIRYLKARAYFSLKEYDKAKEEVKAILKHTSKHLEEFDHLNILSGAHNILSNVYYQKNNLPKALQEIEEALNLFNEEGERKEILPMLLRNKVSFLEKLDRIEEAEEVVNKLWGMVNEIENVNTRVTTYEQKARFEYRKKRYDTALKIAWEGVRITAINKLVDQYVELSTLIANIYQSDEKYRKAESIYKAALFVRDKVENKSIIATTLTDLGYLYLKRNRADEAGQCFNDAVKICEDSHYIGHRYVDALTGLGDYLKSKKQLKEAIQRYEKARELAQQQGLSNKQRDIVLRLIKCCQAVNDPKYSHYLKLLPDIDIQLQKEELPIW